MSDLHITDIEPVDPRRPAWRRYKQADVSSDARLVAFLAHVRALTAGEPTELVLAGDIFDFDTVMARPEPDTFALSWLEKQRGMAPEEGRSAWKMKTILSDHPALVAALHAWMAAGNTLVFVIGNHDLELHWPAVQSELRAALDPPRPGAMTVCEFFRVSGGDTLVMHGNQLDPYCVCHDPLHPFIDVNGALRIRSPFGNLAGKLMLNGMGFLNPHVESSFIRPFREYVRFFLRYLLRDQPFLVWTWLWTASATLWVSVTEGLRPGWRDPVRLDERVRDAARRSNSSSRVVLALRDLHVHPAVYNPLRVARELWLDRAGLLLLLLMAGFQVGSLLNWISGASVLWAGVVFLALLPLFVTYARSCRSEVGGVEENVATHVGTLARIAGVRRVVMGHTHRAGAQGIDGVSSFNTGHWSPAFDDVECTQPVGVNGFVWVRPGEGERRAELRSFDGESSRVLATDGAPVKGRAGESAA